MWHKSKLDHNQLRKEIREMSVRSKLYKLLEEELTYQDHWKQKGRWNPTGFNNEKNI
jgi:hypothetical protein